MRAGNLLHGRSLLARVPLSHLPHGDALHLGGCGMAGPSSAGLRRPAVKVLCHSNCSVRIVFNWDVTIEF